jgi:hypothetical protein
LQWLPAHYIAAHEAGWRNPKHRQQWRNTLTAYVEPIIGAAAAADVDANMVLRVLQPIWNVKPETASRVRSRIEMVLDCANALAIRRYRGVLVIHGVDSAPELCTRKAFFPQCPSFSA